MNDTEKKFLLAVERGDMNTLKTLLGSNVRHFNIDCCDPLARSALVIAIDNENLEMVKLLIGAGVDMGDALLYAIDVNFVEAVELLLDYEEARTRQGEPRSWEQDRENSSFSADMTPLILAAHRNNFEVIKILLDRDFDEIPDPHDPKCDCDSCKKAIADDCLKHSRSRIHAYRALASPCLIALSSADPILRAFELSAKLESLGNMEPEYKQEYFNLRTQCQTFVTKLLDHARTSKELEILLNYSDEGVDEHDSNPQEFYSQCSFYEMASNASVSTVSTSLEDQSNTSNYYAVPLQNYASLGKTPIPPLNRKKSMLKKTSMLSLDSVTGRHEFYGSHMRLARLRLAIQCKMKTFCAHPNIQELLANKWYENLPGFRNRNAFSQMLQMLFIGIMFPVYSIAYLIAPQTQLGRYIKKPFIKFICHSASYITFLVILILASQRIEAFYSWSGVMSIFSLDIPQITGTETNFTLLKQLKSAPTEYDDKELNLLASMYEKLGKSPGQSSARGLESLSKIFEQLPASARKRGTPPSPIELLILVWVISLLWAEIKQLRALGMNYYKSDMWNTLDSVASGFYIGTIIFRVISYLEVDQANMDVAREHWNAYDPTLLSEGLFAAATIFSALKLVYIFSVNPYLGPLQISLGRMIVDILRFSWIYLLVLFSFACGMNQLLWYYADLERHQCLNITNYNLAQFYSAKHDLAEYQESILKTQPGESPTILHPTIKIEEVHDGNNTEELLIDAAFRASLEADATKPPITLDASCKTWRHFSNVFESSQTLFWATFGLVDLENFDLTGIRQYTRFWALLMFGCYCFINVIVVLNLLVAMMNHSYEKISKKSDIEWKFARTRLWMSYFDTGSTVPAPFNIIPSVKSVLGFTRILRKPKHSLRVSPNRENRSLKAQYNSVMQGLVRRYLVNEQREVERRELTEAKLNRWAELKIC